MIKLQKNEWDGLFFIVGGIGGFVAWVATGIQELALVDWSMQLSAIIQSQQFLEGCAWIALSLVGLLFASFGMAISGWWGKLERKNRN